jgi:hypothetical protein
MDFECLQCKAIPEWSPDYVEGDSYSGMFVRNYSCLWNVIG